MHVCVGSDCRGDRPGAHKKLRAALRDAGVPFMPVKCQKVCKGPVVGVRTDGALHWLRDLSGGDLREDLLRLVRRGKWSKALEKRRVKKRKDKLRS